MKEEKQDLCILSYLVHKFAHDSIPLFRLGIVHPVHVIGHQFDCVLETDLAGDPLEQIDAETLESRVTSQILVFFYHNVGSFLWKIGSH